MAYIYPYINRPRCKNGGLIRYQKLCLIELHPLDGKAFLINMQHTDEEIWRDIPGWEELYQISSHGRVKSLSRYVPHKIYGLMKVKERILREKVKWNGYHFVDLYKKSKGKSLSIHTIMGMAFLGHKNNDRRIVVDHKDNIRSHNHISNLHIITQRLNTSKNKKNKTSQYTGVCWVKTRNKWRATIQINGKGKSLGSFTSELAASEAYQRAIPKIT